MKLSQLRSAINRVKPYADPQLPLVYVRREGNVVQVGCGTPDLYSTVQVSGAVGKWSFATGVNALRNQPDVPLFNSLPKEISTAPLPWPFPAAKENAVDDTVVSGAVLNRAANFCKGSDYHAADCVQIVSSHVYAARSGTALRISTPIPREFIATIPQKAMQGVRDRDDVVLRRCRNWTTLDLLGSSPVRVWCKNRTRVPLTIPFFKVKDHAEESLSSGVDFIPSAVDGYSTISLADLRQSAKAQILVDTSCLENAIGQLEPGSFSFHFPMNPESARFVMVTQGDVSVVLTAVWTQDS